MEDEKSTASSSIAEEISKRKETASPSKSSSSSGYFSSVFPPASMVMGKDLSPSDLHWILFKQRSEGQIGQSRSMTADVKPQSKLDKCRIINKKDEKLSYSEALEPAYFGSSLHYGGREFYSSSPSTHTSEIFKTYKNNEEDNMTDSNAATRGDWWQGSLYY